MSELRVFLLIKVHSLSSQEVKAVRQMKFGQLKKYNVRNIFPKNSRTK